MAKKKRPGKGAIYTGKHAVHQEQWQRREIARLLACGYGHAEIAHKLKLHPNTMTKQVRIVELQWWESQQVNTGERITKEAARLEFMRNEALRCFYESANRHGETLQTGYLQLYAKFTDQLHTLLRLTDPLVAPSMRSKETLPIVPVKITSREEARLFQGGVMDPAEFKSMINDHAAEAGTGAES